MNAKIRGFMVFWRFRAARHFSRVNSVEIAIDMENLRVKFSAPNVDFDSPSLNFLGSRKPGHQRAVLK